MRRNRRKLFLGGLALLALVVFVGALALLLSHGDSDRISESVGAGSTQMASDAGEVTQVASDAEDAAQIALYAATATARGTGLGAATQTAQPSVTMSGGGTQVAFSMSPEASTPLPPPGGDPGATAIAEAPVTLRLYGDFMGRGTLRLYAPDAVQYPGRARVELELFIEDWQATPLPEPGESGGPAITATPRATATPRTERTEKLGQGVYQRMAASLDCRARDFEECAGYGDREAQEVGSTGLLRWTWDLTPWENVQGPQPLTVALWRPDETAASGQDVSRQEWFFDFTIDVIGVSSALAAVNPDGQAVPPNATGISAPTITITEKVEGSDDGISLVAIVAGVIAAGVSVAIAGAVLVRRHRHKPRPLAFISYQRRTGWVVARTLRDRLDAMGAEVFIDVENINEGRFAQVIEGAIARCDYFVVVLAPGTLESAWVQREIETALRHDRVIIPVLVEGFQFDESLPSSIAELTSHNAITLSPEFFEAAMARLARFLKLG